MEQVQQLEPSTTDPRPPTGQTPTQPPLSLSAQVGTSSQENNVLIPTELNFLEGYPIFLPLKTFEISLTTAMDTELCKLTLADVFAGQKSRKSTPFQFRQLLFSRRFFMNVTFLLYPIKVGDTPVTLDVFTNYTSGTMDKSLNNYNKDYAEVAITKSEILAVPLPLTWPTGQTFTYYELNQKPVYAPFTELQIRMKNMYAPTALHPQSFSVLVFAVVHDGVYTEEYAPSITTIKNFWLANLA